jgi:hypothetical protein
VEVIDTAYSGCMKDFNTVVVAVVVVDEDAVVEDNVDDLKITTINYSVECQAPSKARSLK